MAPNWENTAQARKEIGNEEAEKQLTMSGKSGMCQLM